MSDGSSTNGDRKALQVCITGLNHAHVREKVPMTGQADGSSAFCSSAASSLFQKAMG